MLKIGAHQSITGSYHNALAHVNEIGGNCLQIFSSSPKAWSFAKLSDQNTQNYLDMKTKLKIDPVYFHSSYLINLANTERIGQMSKQSLKHELKIASELKIKGSIIHLGSYKKLLLDDRLRVNIYQNLIFNIKDIINNTPDNTLFIIENAGNKKIGQSLEEISQIVKDVNNPRVKVCLDTCHLYSAGYDLSTSEKLVRFLETFESLIGLEKLELFHFNDSKDPFNSGRDKHENIGKGTIPIEEFKLIMTHPKLKHLPFIIETPGFDNNGPDKQNLDILKGLLA
jgi:deoxyribonuclease IV